METTPQSRCTCTFSNKIQRERLYLISGNLKYSEYMVQFYHQILLVNRKVTSHIEQMKFVIQDLLNRNRKGAWG